MIEIVTKNQSPKDILTKELLQKHFVDLNKNIVSIAREFNIKSHNSVYMALKRHGFLQDKMRSSRVLTKKY